MHCAAGTFSLDFENLPENSDDLINEALKSALVADAGAFFFRKLGRAVVTDVISVGVNVIELRDRFCLRRGASRAVIDRFALFGAGRVFHGEKNERVRRLCGLFLRDGDSSANRTLLALGQARL